MQRKSIVLIFIILTSGLLLMGNISAQSQAGVSLGDNFTYDFSAYIETTIPDFPIPNGLIENNKTQWIKLQITEVNEPIIEYSIVEHLENGTENVGSGQIDLETGLGEFPFVFTNLQVGDPIFPSDPVSPIVNETITRSFQQTVKEINHVTWNETSGYYDLFIDKNTGAMVEFNIEFPINMETQAIYSYELIDTNLWIIPEFPKITSLSIIIIAVSLSIIIYKNKFRTSNKK